MMAFMLVEHRDCREDAPNPRRVLGGSQHARPGRVEHCALDPFLMAAQHGEFGACRSIPQPRCLIRGGGQGIRGLSEMQREAAFFWHKHGTSEEGCPIVRAP